jgi:hypothetical protein
MEGGKSKPMDETDGRLIYSTDKSENESVAALAECWAGLKTVRCAFPYANHICSMRWP